VATTVHPPVTGAAIGDVKDWPSNTVPSGWMLCDGTAISRSTFATLFGVIGITYGAGDGSTTFNLPDCRGRARHGKGTHTEVGALGDNDALAVASRRVTHKHSVNDPGHNHSVSDSGHSHTLRDSGNGGTIYRGDAGGPGWAYTGSGANSGIPGVTTVNGTGISISSGSAGITVGPAGTPSDIVPFIIFNTIIKAS
jgi:microcystin-dependent protein